MFLFTIILSLVYFLSNYSFNINRAGTTFRYPLYSQKIGLDLIFWGFFVLNATFSNIMATSFIGGRSRSTRGEPPTMGKQLVNFISMFLFTIILSLVYFLSNYSFNIILSLLLPSSLYVP
jgi:hypothetical protein